MEQLNKVQNLSHKTNRYDNHLIIGPAGSGKTTLIKQIIKTYIDDDKTKKDIFLFTDKTINNYDDIFTELDNIIHPDNYVEMFDKIIEKIDQQLTNDTLIIFDDVLHTKIHQTVMNVLFNSRHRKIKFICSIQKPIKFPVELRVNFEYIYLFKEQFIKNKQKLYDDWGGIFPTFDIFNNAIESLKNKEVMILDNVSRTAEINNRVYRYEIILVSEKLASLSKII